MSGLPGALKRLSDSIEQSNNALIKELQDHKAKTPAKKPHIVKCTNWNGKKAWHCEGGMLGGIRGVGAIGNTPVEAYQNWAKYHE